MSVEQVLRTGSERWRFITPRGDDLTSVLLSGIIEKLTPTKAIERLIIADEEFSAAAELLAGPLDPPLTAEDRQHLEGLLAAQRRRTRVSAEARIATLHGRAQRAEVDLEIDVDLVLESYEDSAALGRDLLADPTDQLERAEEARLTALAERADELGVTGGLRRRIEPLLRAGLWDVVHELLEGPRPVVAAAIPRPETIPRPAPLTEHPTAEVQVRRLLQLGEPLDDPARELLELALAPEASGADLLAALDCVIGADGVGAGTASGLESLRTIPIPVPSFLGDVGAITLELATVKGSRRRFRVGLEHRAVDLELEDLVRLCCADGDRRVALLRLLGRRMPGSECLARELGESTLRPALAWAFDLAGTQPAAVLIDLLLFRTRGQEALLRAILDDLVEAPDTRGGFVDATRLASVLAQDEVRARLTELVRASLEHDPVAWTAVVLAARSGEDQSVALDDLGMLFELGRIDGSTELDPDDAGLEAARTTLEGAGFVRQRDGVASLSLELLDLADPEAWSADAPG